ncbi:hypothetical protein TNCV_876891 [Trichonephila clavipes]|nr:hypothetical protein TNCV_876891 [Trichonephila clavipes]
MLDSLIQELLIEELREMHEQEREFLELESLDPFQLEDQIRIRRVHYYAVTHVISVGALSPPKSLDKELPAQLSLDQVSKLGDRSTLDPILLYSAILISTL